MVAKKEGVWKMNSSERYLLYSLVAILIIVVIIIGVYVYLSSQFSSGDIVFLKGEVSKIGVVRALSLFQLGYVISWNDGTITVESGFNIEKINKLNPADYKPGNYTKNTTTPVDFNPSGSKSDLTNFSDYAIQKDSDENVVGIFYRGFLDKPLLTQKYCSPNFSCGPWGECKLDYNLASLSLGGDARGIQYNVCFDNNACLPNIVDSRSCSLGENVTVVKKIICGREKIEILDASGTVLANLDLGNTDNFVDVNIQLISSEEGSC
jgi:hypothetical protein